MEKKVNDKQNQALVDQLAEERINWEKINIRYNGAKKNNKYCSDLLKNYNDSYLMSSALNDLINHEDKIYKKAVNDRERALHRYLQEDIKEKNKFSQNYDISAKKNKRVSKSVIVNKKTMSNLGNEDKNMKVQTQEKIEEGDEDEENEIQHKLENENNMENKELVSS